MPNSTKAQVVTRGTRSLGYGFVTFATSEEAAKAVSSLNGKEIEGRAINVEATKPLAAGGGPKGAEGEGSGARKPRERRPRNGTATAGGAAPKGRRPRVDEGEEEDSAAAPGTTAESGAEGGAAAAGDKKKRKPRNKKKSTAGASADGLGTPAGGVTPGVNGADANGASAGEGLGTPAGGATSSTKPQQQPRAPREKKQPAGPKGAPEGPPSQTLVFVANLSFEINTDELLREKVFAGFDVKTAKVAMAPFRKRSKGYGFVDLASHEEQQRAIKELQGKEIDGREITIKVAVEDTSRKEKEAAAAAAAPATSGESAPAEVKTESDAAPAASA